MCIIMKEEQIKAAFQQGIALQSGWFQPLIYLYRVDEPEFGCEGRPDGGAICGVAYGITLEGERKWQVEERLLWSTGLDDGMWVGKFGDSYALLTAGRQLKPLTEETFHEIFG